MVTGESKTYVDLKVVADNYRATGDRLLAQAEQGWDKGDLLQALEESWGAVTQYLKAQATEYGKKPRDHSEVRQVAQDLDSLVKTRFEEVPAISHICALPYVGVVYGTETVYCTPARVRLF